MVQGGLEKRFVLVIMKSMVICMLLCGWEIMGSLSLIKYASCKMDSLFYKSS